MGQTDVASASVAAVFSAHHDDLVRLAALFVGDQQTAVLRAGRNRSHHPASAVGRHSDTIVVIDLRTGAQRQWRDPRPSIVHGTPMGIGSLSWSDDQTVDFTVT